MRPLPPPSYLSDRARPDIERVHSQRVRSGRLAADLTGIGQRLSQGDQIVSQGRVRTLTHEGLVRRKIGRERSAFEAVEIGFAIFEASLRADCRNG
jgi:hypothetical protein